MSVPQSQRAAILSEVLHRVFLPRTSVIPEEEGWPKRPGALTPKFDAAKRSEADAVVVVVVVVWAK